MNSVEQTYVGLFQSIPGKVTQLLENHLLKSRKKESSN